tara:strand:+ start:7229 stop:8578 length:1350 start_codon:yes stop_codon:yes gene_type:complete
MVIICNIADWNKENINLLARTISPDALILNTSSFRKFDELNIINEFYNHMKKDYKYNPKYKIEDDEIINRCRVLRLLNKDEAKKKVSLMRLSILKVLKSQSIDLVITELVDQYFHDILVREAKKLNIEVFSPIQTFINGYSRLTLYGDNQIVRIPDDEEVYAVSKQLDKQNYKPNYLKNLKVSNFGEHLIRVFKNMLRYIYFNLKLLYPRDKYDYHYLASSKGILRYSSIFQIIDFKVSFDWKNKLSNSSKLKIYIPLQWFPESTIDYWCRNIEVIDFENVFLEIVLKLSKKFTVVLKEHPAALGFRNPKFIEKVNSMLCDNILCVPSNIPSNVIISKVNSALVWTGSAGFEAAYRGKPVFTLGNPYYSSGRFFYKVSLKTSINDFENFINECEKYPIKKPEKNELVRNLLSGFIKGFFRNDGSFDNNNNKHKTEIITLANNISKHFLK